MRIDAQMNLDELVLLMGERHGVERPAQARFASKDEAQGLRSLLARDFEGMSTDDIDVGTWHAYCCAVDPYQSIFALDAKRSLNVHQPAFPNT